MSFYERNKDSIFWFFLIIVIIISSVSLFFSLKKTSHTETLYSTDLNDATLLQNSEMELLYSHALNSEIETANGFFTITVDGNFQVPSIKYDVRDQTNRRILTGDVTVGKITKVNFEGTSNTSVINLFIHTKQGNINLKNLTITLNDSYLYTI